MPPLDPTDRPPEGVEPLGTARRLDPEPLDLREPHVVNRLELFAELITRALESDAREEEARAGRQRFESFVMGAPLAIAVYRGPQLVYDSVNEHYLDLIGHRHLLGQPGRAVFPELGPTWDALEAVYATGAPHAEAATAAVFAPSNTPGSPPRYFDWVAQATRDPSGVIDGVILFAIDVTPTVVARRLLEGRNRELDSFASVASHDLKAPLRGIRHLAEWIREDLGPSLSAEGREHLAALDERVAQMTALVDGLLAYARAGETAESLTELDVGEVLADAVAILDVPPEVRLEIGPMPTLHGSRVALLQIFRNLIGNAIHHAARPDVTVAISAVEQPLTWLFAVEDDGQGVPLEHRERIWKLFESLSSKEHGNTGLGLAIVRKVVESRGGGVAVGASARGGARFAFSWPKNERALGL